MSVLRGKCATGLLHPVKWSGGSRHQARCLALIVLLQDALQPLLSAAGS